MQQALAGSRARRKKNSHAASEEKNSHAASEEKNSAMRQALAGSRAPRKKTVMQPVKKKNSHAASEEKNSHEASEEKKTASCNKHLLAVEKRESVGSNSRPACSIRVKPTSRTLKLSVFNSPHSLFNKDKWGKLPSN
jgi:hypothetical protein